MNSEDYYSIQFDKKIKIENKMELEKVALFTAPFIEKIEGKGILVLRINKTKYLVQAQKM